jgi:hypothetical protein
MVATICLTAATSVGREVVGRPEGSRRNAADPLQLRTKVLASPGLVHSRGIVPPPSTSLRGRTHLQPESLYSEYQR